MSWSSWCPGPGALPLHAGFASSTIAQAVGRLFSPVIGSCVLCSRPTASKVSLLPLQRRLSRRISLRRNPWPSDSSTAPNPTRRCMSSNKDVAPHFLSGNCSAGQPTSSPAYGKPVADERSLSWAQDKNMPQLAPSHSGRLVPSAADKAQGGGAATQAAVCLRRSAGRSSAAAGPKGRNGSPASCIRNDRLLRQEGSAVVV